MNKAFIFDMDGTLFQTNLILEPALDATFDVLRTNGLWQGETPIEKYRDNGGSFTCCVGNIMSYACFRDTRREQCIIPCKAD